MGVGLTNPWRSKTLRSGLARPNDSNPKLNFHIKIKIK
jgi:hypothetical protein